MMRFLAGCVIVAALSGCNAHRQVEHDEVAGCVIDDVFHIGGNYDTHEEKDSHEIRCETRGGSALLYGRPKKCPLLILHQYEETHGR